MEPTFFETPQDIREWFVANHETATELLVGFYKKGSGKPSITWTESVDQALCFGWIDGRAKGIDEERWGIRFTPRRPKSIWSAVNIIRVEELVERGLMYPAGLKAFEARTEERSNQYAFEQPDTIDFEPEMIETFQGNDPAWTFFQAQPPGYRKTVTWWVISAKRPETRSKRLETLIDDSTNGRRLTQLARPTKGNAGA